FDRSFVDAGRVRQCTDANVILVGIIFYRYMCTVIGNLARQSLDWIFGGGRTSSLLPLYLFQSRAESCVGLSTRRQNAITYTAGLLLNIKAVDPDELRTKNRNSSNAAVAYPSA